MHCFPLPPIHCPSALFTLPRSRPRLGSMIQIYHSSLCFNSYNHHHALPTSHRYSIFPLSFPPILQVNLTLIPCFAHFSSLFALPDLTYLFCFVIAAMVPVPSGSHACSGVHFSISLVLDFSFSPFSESGVRSQYSRVCVVS